MQVYHSTVTHRVEHRGGPRNARCVTRTAGLRAQPLDGKAVALQRRLMMTFSALCKSAWRVALPWLTLAARACCLALCE